MEKLTLTDITRRTAGGYVIDRKCEHNVAIGYNGVGNILTYTLTGEPTDINSAVLEMMIMAAQDVLDMSKPMFKGDFTAKELAGKVSGFSPVVFIFTNEQYVSYQRICIECGTFKCHFEAKEMFVMLSEWEGMMSIPQNKAHRFPCEAEKEMEKDVIIKPYKCSRGYRPRRIVINDPDQERIERKYGTIGRLAQSLTEEGMKRAFSTASVILEYEGHPLHDIAKTVLSKKLHDDYGVKDTQPVTFDRSAFECAPECWIVEDRAYMQELRDCFNRLTAEYPAPDWMKVGDFVQRKNQHLAPKKWQGKLKVCHIEPLYECNIIRWYVRVSTTKGKWDYMDCRADWLEVWTEPEPKMKSEKVKKLKGEKPQPSVIKPQPSFADLLRKVLFSA